MEKHTASGKNIGICLLRILGSFVVVSCHYGKVPEVFAPYRSLAVPCFMMLSFYFFGKAIAGNKIDQSWTIRRIGRLICPYFIWPCLYFVIYSVCNFIFASIPVTWTDLLWQLSLGHSGNLCTPLWFHFSLMILTLVFAFICKINEKHRSNIVNFCVVLGILSLYLQYSEINYTTFVLRRFEVSYPLGRTIEMIPYAVVGIILGYYGFFEKITKGNRMFTILICVSAFYSMDHLNMMITPNGFGYQGLNLLLSAVCIIAVFVALPLEALGKYFSYYIDRISTYSLGIYCIHILVGNLLNQFLNGLGVNTYTFSDILWIWLISLLICVFIGKIPNKIIRNLVT